MGILSQRTAIRDLVFSELSTISTSDPSGQWQTSPELHKFWVEHDQATRYPALCVVLTDEAYKLDRMQGITVDCKMKIIGYVSNPKDSRAELDKLIEDVIYKLSSSGAIRQAVTNLAIDSLHADEGTSVAQPFAQFVMVWTFEFQRRFGFAG